MNQEKEERSESIIRDHSFLSCKVKESGQWCGESYSASWLGNTEEVPGKAVLSFKKSDIQNI